MHRIYRGLQNIQFDQGKHGYTLAHRVNKGTQDIQGYTGYTVSLG